MNGSRSCLLRSVVSAYRYNSRVFLRNAIGFVGALDSVTRKVRPAAYSVARNTLLAIGLASVLFVPVVTPVAADSLG